MRRRNFIEAALVLSLLLFLPGSSARAFTGGQSPSLTISDGLSSPAGIAFDPSGNLWVSDNGLGEALEFVPPFASGGPPAVELSNGLEGPAGITFSSGNLWIADYSANKVLEYASPITSGSSPALALSNGMRSPIGLAFDSSGDLWVADFGEFETTNSSDINIPAQTTIPGSVLEFKPPFSSGESPSLNISSGLVNPLALAFSSGDLLVADQGMQAVLMFGPPFSNSSSPTIAISNSLTDPAGITIDTAGDVWVADYGSRSVFEFVPPLGGSPAVALTNGLSDPTAIAFDHTGNLWIADKVAGKVFEIANPNPSSPGITSYEYLLAVPAILAVSIVAYFLALTRSRRGRVKVASATRMGV